MTQHRTIQGNDAMRKLVKEGRDQNPPDESYADALPMETHTLQRDNNIPLQFRGRLIGSTDPQEEGAVGTKVSIYVTGKGKIVTHIFQWQRKDNWTGEGLAPIKRSRKTAGIHVEGADALAWLIEDGGGTLGSSSRRAWEMACANWPPLQGQHVEVID